jgi:hypothetical protein
MSHNAEGLSAEATAWMDSLWDPEARLLRCPGGHAHMVRETSWYAAGLLTRGGDGDRDRAAEAIMSVLNHQFEAPGRPYHGTWRRSPDEPDPPPHAAEWRDYDPNWREFVGCALLLILDEFESELPAALIERIDRALSLAADGARARAVAPSYTNIALMGAYLFDGVGHRLRAADLRQTGEDLARQVHSGWARTSSFPEFNSPTYYGVDLFALALWRSRAPSPVLRRLGADMEQGLWREIGARYHPGLRNMAGPFDRTYGMDMRRYAALLGLWIGFVVGRERAPLPAGGPSASEHAADWCFAPCFALLGAAPPAEVADRLVSAPANLTPPCATAPCATALYVTTTIGSAPTASPDSSRGVATSWIGPRHMIGAQDAGGTMNDANEQYCPVIVHWSAPGLAGNSDEVNWLRVAPMTPVDAEVDEDGTLHLIHHDRADHTSLCFQAYAPRANPGELAAYHWRLPGLTVRLSATEDIEVATSRSDDLLRITYVLKSSMTDVPFRLSLHISS